MAAAPVDRKPLRAEPILAARDFMHPGTYRRPQGLDDPLLVLTLGGKAMLGSADRKFELRAGDLILIEPHRAIDQDVEETDRAWERIWIVFDPRAHWREWLAWPQLALGYRGLKLTKTPEASAARKQLDATHRLANNSTRDARQFAMNALELALLWCNAINPRAEPARPDERVARAVNFVTGDLARRLTLDDIAESAGLSVAHLAKLFRRHLGLSPMQFVERQRMRRATELLQITSKSIGQIAVEVGFDDPFYFSTRFRRYSGKSPREYRRTI